MQYHIEFLDDVNTIIFMMPKVAESSETALRLVVENGWPRGSHTAHVFDRLGHVRIFETNVAAKHRGYHGVR